MILSALFDYYQRLSADGKVPQFGYSSEQISFVLLLKPDGTLVDIKDIRDSNGKKPSPKLLEVPQKPAGGTSNIAPKFLWDKSSYVLGVGGRKPERTADEHAAFKALHEHWLGASEDAGLQAVLRFLRRWHPQQFDAFDPAIRETLPDANIVFRLDGEREYVHQRLAARQLRTRMLATADGETGTCLISGQTAQLARLHPPIKGVDGAQTSGASIVSFNLDAFTSYGKTQGANAPISEHAAFAYTTALNHLLRRGKANHQRLQLGNTTVVFWAQASNDKAAETAEDLVADWLDPPADDDSETRRALPALQALAAGRPLKDPGLELEPGTRLFILGLAPNASRLSIRFWQTERLEEFAQRLAAHYRDLELQPLPWRQPPGIQQLLLTTAAMGEPKNIPPQLAGELTRSILTGGRYPRSLLSILVMRMRADGKLSGLRIALCKAVLSRDQRLGMAGINLELPVSLDKTVTDPGYLLGRLFAELENIQRAALGDKINATIRDRYYGAASATPASVFPLLLRNSMNHLGRLRKDKPGLAVMLEKNIGDIMNGLDNQFPKSMTINTQGQFAIGYYHQSQSRFQKTATDVTNADQDD